MLSYKLLNRFFPHHVFDEINKWRFLDIFEMFRKLWFQRNCWKYWKKNTWLYEHCHLLLPWKTFSSYICLFFLFYLKCIKLLFSNTPTRGNFFTKLYTLLNYTIALQFQIFLSKFPFSITINKPKNPTFFISDGLFLF